MWERQVWGSSHCGNMGTLGCLDASASIMPQLCGWEGILRVGGVVGLLGFVFPPRGVRHGDAQTCRMKSHLAIGHMIFGSLCFAGQLNKDVTYSQLYSFLDCLQVWSEAVA